MPFSFAQAIFGNAELHRSWNRKPQATRAKTESETEGNCEPPAIMF
jgi:hypothetical protein